MIEDRRKSHNLTDDQLEQIAARAAEIAIERMTSEVYQTVGKTVITKLAYSVGVACVGFTLFAASKGWVKL